LGFRATTGIHPASTLTMSKKQPKHLVDPTQLKPIDGKDGTLQVIIETPKGSRNKYAYDTEQGIFSLTKVLPAGMAFPYDFGFLPRTLAPMEMPSMYFFSWTSRHFLAARSSLD